MPPPVGAPTGVRAPTTAGPQIPDQAIDVAAIDVKGAELKKLPAAYQRAVTDAKAYAAKSFKDMAPPPKVLVTPSSAKTNGGQPVTLKPKVWSVVRSDPNVPIAAVAPIELTLAGQ